MQPRQGNPVAGIGGIFFEARQPEELSNVLQLWQPDGARPA
jgi:hypothetical protein